MEPVKVLMLVETTCYNALMNKHYGNPPLEITTLTCITANRLLPCSLCLPHSNKTFHFDAPPTTIVLPPLTSQSSPHSPTQSTSNKKLKLTVKERDPARSTLKKFRNNLRFAEQNAGRFRHHPPALFNQILDNLLSLVSSSDLYPLLGQWYHRETHTDALFEAVVEIQTKIHGKRERARLEKNRKARETRQANKRKAVDSGQIRRQRGEKRLPTLRTNKNPSPIWTMTMSLNSTCMYHLTQTSQLLCFLRYFPGCGLVYGRSGHWTTSQIYPAVALGLQYRSSQML
ncbi:hypothetical protein B0H14DRAFT_2645612 [Mycena olivaceomarginata]|nr:hypothetical protein B0H14DRAFT_2645612 [Mycena olivaceomarginata]